MLNYIEKIKEVAASIYDIALAEVIINECKVGQSFFFGYDDCFVVLKPSIVNESLCVHIQCAYSERNNGFYFGYKFVSERASEIGAKYVTFSTANKKLEAMASRFGWAKLEQGEVLSSWIIEL